MKPIPEMTDAELNEAMAVEVMGWCEGEHYYKHTSQEIVLIDEDDNQLNYWHPATDLNQAWECVNHFYNTHGFNLKIYGADKLYMAWLNKSDENRHNARAVCEAVLMAVRSER